MTSSNIGSEMFENAVSPSEEDGKDRRERLGKNLLSLGGAVIVTDLLGSVILINPAAESLTGWTDAEAENQPIESVFRIIDEITRLPVLQPVKEVIAHGITQDLAQFTLLIAKDGVERHIDDSAAPLLDEMGNIEGVILIFKDVAKRRRREIGLERFRLPGEVIIAAIRDPLVVLDFDLRIRSANQSFREFFQTTSSQTIGKSFLEIGDGRWDVEGLRIGLRKILDDDVPLNHFEVEKEFEAIGWRTMVLNAQKMHAENGRGAMIVLTMKDISDRSRLKSPPAASELQFRRLFEAAKDGILILDGRSGAITDANPFILKLLGYTHTELMGKRLWEIGLLGDEEASLASFRELQEKGYVRYDDLPMRTRDGDQIEVEVVSNVYRTGDVTVIQCNIRDVTERKLADDRLRRAKETAEEAGRTKDLFLATLSHELRTPLTPVLATVELFETRPDFPEALRENLALIRRNIELEARLIDDLLDATRISQGKLELRREILDVHALVRSALEFCQAEVEDKDLEISLALRAKNHLVWADSARMQQVFWNLIKNAVKFTPREGKISIRSSSVAEGRLAIDVVDTGTGLEPETLKKIFGLFEQGDREVTRKHGGLGLGLAIAKMLVDLHGGELSAASQGKGTGSTFRVELETVPKVGSSGHGESPHPSLDDGGTPSKILLVEDNVDTLHAITQLLRSAGFIVSNARNVKQGLEALGSGGFDLLVSDIGLPDGSGLELMRFAQENSGTKGIAFSGYCSEEDVAASMAAGFSHHLAKPTNLKHLIDLIRQTAV